MSDLSDEVVRVARGGAPTPRGPQTPALRPGDGADPHPQPSELDVLVVAIGDGRLR